MDGKITKIDARTSDAIAIGVRFQCPVYTFESILSSAGILLDESTEEDENLFAEMSEEEDENKDSIESRSVEELEAQLTDALANEEYERASKLRDEINKRGA